ncbi:pro-sigmaK processing inhibitor BofA family protein [Amphibacillus jilinensis]|uniref:pro-sigmaK processing inhibitor BofA family protein n=1 Tax=Amphibacillus jilinensis TaxID=1216008 RepID=UPI000302F2FE|nr:pro-sigmaK processing inhibitor BofA family protein [Amphibacillus jilinensis]
MQQIIIVAVVCIALMGLFHLPALKWMSTGFVKIVIGALMLFFLNILSGSFGLHIPINLFTAITVGFLGLPGVVALSSLHLFVI